MSLTHFQAQITVTSVQDVSDGAGTWLITMSVLDYEGIYNARNVTVGDVIILDTSMIETGTLSRYTIDSIGAQDAFNVEVTATYDISNGPSYIDLYGYELSLPGLVTRRTPNISLVNIPSPQIQVLPDKFVSYVINFMSNDIVDNIADTLVAPVQSLTNSTPTPVTIGGVAAGTTFDHIPVQDVLQELLYPYQVPTFSQFSITGQASPIEVGATIPASTYAFTWATTNSSNIVADSVLITDVTNSVALASSIANNGTRSIALDAITKTSALSHMWRISATDTKSSTLTKEFTVSWQWKRFFGESTNASLTETQVKALRISGLATGFAGTYSFSAGGYKYVAYPALFGTATSFKDQSTNLDVPFQTVQIASITNNNGITTNYNIHRTVNIIGSAIVIVVA